MRNITDLHPSLQDKTGELKFRCEQQGLNIGIGECVRTVAEQDALYAQGRTTPGNIVTKAKGSTYSSQHQWGIAFDFYRNDGTGAFENGDGFFEKVGAIGKSIGLGWGGDWTSIKDRPHLYLPDWGSTASKLKAQYGTPEAFKKTWGNHAVQKPAQEPEQPVNTIGSGVVITKVDPLTIRSQPNTGSLSLGSIPKGATVKILEQGTEWHRVQYQDRTGYCSAKYIQIKAEPTEKPVEEYKVGQVYTLLVELKVREGAGTQCRAKTHGELTTGGKDGDADKDGALDQGTRVTCQEVKKVGNDTWILIPSGWIAAIYNGKKYVG